jgi:hypothetical protein
MPQGHVDETKVTGRLPNLDIEINYSRSPAGDAERLLISVQAVPSFEAFGRYLEAVNPFLFWMRLAQTAWTPWLGAPRAALPGSSSTGRLPPAGEAARPGSAPLPGQAG